MSIERKVKLVEKLFCDLELESVQFKKESGLRCVSGCGNCCTHPNLDASPLEFLPWAFHLFLNGEAENTLVELNQTNSKTCHIYKSLTVLGKGRCSAYKYRGLICRLFGFGATRDKFGQLRLATCKTIKEGQTENYGKTVKSITNGMFVPVFADYYMKLSQIDHHMGNTILPVNKALKIALEEVLQYYYYRPYSGAHLNCG
ncbi:YkgJ family cysteine cluster protein [Brumimicrobium mesophilum]|uniref:YkgJ family cysteine cluster protein n=1 Tax=Brumimicrobium mesophilum TaxID=392717 RepID=UPI000D13F6C2|nr:YkgJ family cysteine cluster protein [Brumimicrobium mesophilum]